MQIGRRARYRPKSLETLFFLHFTILSFVFSVVLSVAGAHPCPIDNPHPGKWEGRKARYRPPVCGSRDPAPCQSVCCSCNHSTTIQSATYTCLRPFCLGYGLLRCLVIWSFCLFVLPWRNLHFFNCSQVSTTMLWKTVTVRWYGVFPKNCHAWIVKADAMVTLWPLD